MKEGVVLNPTHDCCIHTFFPRIVTEGHIIHPIKMTNVLDIQPRTVRVRGQGNVRTYQLSPVAD